MGKSIKWKSPTGDEYEVEVPEGLDETEFASLLFEYYHRSTQRAFRKLMKGGDYKKVMQTLKKENDTMFKSTKNKGKVENILSIFKTKRNK